MKLASSAFCHGSPIPERCTGQGQGVSPPLEWQDLPKGTQSIALVCQDLDGRIQPHWDSTLVHWLIYNIPAWVMSLPEGVPEGEKVSGLFSATQGTNSFGKIGYRGPIPPVEDQEHHYRFCLYALDSDLDLPPGLMYPDLLGRMEEHILGIETIDGIYKRVEDRSRYQDISKDAPSPELGF